MPKNKKFDKKKSVTFQLVHRSQQDPLIVDDNAPQRVFVPVDKDRKPLDRQKQLELQREHGIFFEDDCNYLKHLKDAEDNQMAWPDNVSEELVKLRESKIQLPPEVLPSEVEEEVGMLSKAAPCSGLPLNLDPDVMDTVAALDDDFDFSDPDNQLEDNFMELANGAAEEFDERDEDGYLSSDFEDEDSANSERSFEKMETKSKFSTYSMSSSVLPRNENLLLLDKQFDQALADYDNESDSDDSDQKMDQSEIDYYMQFADEIEKKKSMLDQDATLNEKTVELAEKIDEEKPVFVTVEVQKKPQWDCESVISTYSNIYNRPRIIEIPRKIRIDKATGLPVKSNRLTRRALKSLEVNDDQVSVVSCMSRLSELSFRPKNETPEERRERKKQLKEYKQERRSEKKINKLAFKDEAKKQRHVTADKMNVKGQKLA